MVAGCCLYDKCHLIDNLEFHVIHLATGTSIQFEAFDDNEIKLSIDYFIKTMLTFYLITFRYATTIRPIHVFTHFASQAFSHSFSQSFTYECLSFWCLNKFMWHVSKIGIFCVQEIDWSKSS